jgi:hypothetical protein
LMASLGPLGSHFVNATAWRFGIPSLVPRLRCPRFEVFFWQ